MRLRRHVSLLWLCLTLLVSACSGGPDGTSSPFLLSPTGGTSSPVPATSGPAAPPQITLAFGGDVHFTQRTLALLDNPPAAFGPVSAIFTAADLAMVNLETAVTTRGTPEPKEFHFRAPPTAFEAVKAAGLDVVTLANNHTLDYGQVGLADTLDFANVSGVPVVGAGRDAASAYAPWVTTVKGVRIAFLGFSQITELASSWAATDSRPGIAMAFHVNRAVAAVRAARAAADVVVVYMHWGQEYRECPIEAQTSFASTLADAGATLIVGTHVHVMQGDGWLGHTFVAYGLSNFVWWLNDAQSNDTGVLRVTFAGSQIAKTEFLPAYISRTTGQPVPSTGEGADRISAEHAALRACTGLADAAG